jgi:type I restriction enzyme S subunit
MVLKATGANYPAVTDKIVKQSAIPLPSLDEQRRIAAILDNADALRAKRCQVLDHLDALTQSIFHDMFAQTAEDGQLGDVCSRVTDGTHQPPKWETSGIPFLFVSNITSGEIDLRTEKFISEKTWRGLTRRSPIEAGDVLYSTVGSYGIPVVVRTAEKFAFQRHIAHIKPLQDHLLPEFLAAQLASPTLKHQAERVARGIAQPTVNLEDIRNFKIIIPTLEEQRRFVTYVEQINVQRAVVQQVIRSEEDLTGSLRADAFRGDL